MRSGLSVMLAAILLALVCILIAPYASQRAAQASAPPAQGLQQDSAGQSPFLIVYPELRQAPAPAWLRPGMRLSYNFAFATFARSADDPTPSGSAVLQYDVVAQDRRNVVVVPTSYGSWGQPPTPLGYQVGLPGLGEFWFAPQVLANAEAAAHDRFLVNRLTIEVEGKRYAVVRMQSNTDGGETVWEFDEQTGMLVFYRQTLYDANGEQTSSNMLTLVSSRQVKLPWRFGSVPTWVKRGTEIRLVGSQMLDLGAPPYIPLPMGIHLQIDKVGSLWSEFAQTTWFNSRQTGQSSGATGVAQIFGGIWLPPEALNMLEAGDVLDRDPITQVVTHVDEANGQRIAISAQDPASLTRYIYDARAGRLIGYYQEARMPSGTQYTELAAQ